MLPKPIKEMITDILIRDLEVGIRGEMTLQSR